MSARRFTHVRLLNAVRVMSDGHLIVTVIMDGGPRRAYSPDYHEFEALPSAPSGITWAAPDYLYTVVDALVVDLLSGDRVKYYECDRDGTRRYEGLRYHDPERIAWLIETLKGRVIV